MWFVVCLLLLNRIVGRGLWFELTAATWMKRNGNRREKGLATWWCSNNNIINNKNQKNLKKKLVI